MQLLKGYTKYCIGNLRSEFLSSYASSSNITLPLLQYTPVIFNNNLKFQTAEYETYSLCLDYKGTNMCTKTNLFENQKIKNKKLNCWCTKRQRKRRK